MSKIVKLLRFVFFSSLVFFFMTLWKKQKDSLNDVSEEQSEENNLKSTGFIKEFQHLGQANVYPEKNSEAAL